MAQESKKKRPQKDQNFADGPDLRRIVHDLNNMLYALGGFMDIAIDELPVGHPAREALAEATRASDGATALVAKLVPAQVLSEGGDQTEVQGKVTQIPKVMSARRVLVIEEDAMVAELLTRALRRFGFEPTVASGAREALAMFLAAVDGFDAIVADELSPKTEGVEAVMQMQDANPRLPIILMTSGRDSVLTSRAIEAGIQHILHKPVKIRELCRTLEELTLTIVD